jgi:hypothetical protein
VKNLATCKPTEFLRQTNRIRKYVAQWLDMTGILDIRKDMPEVDKNASEEEKVQAIREQARKNISRMFDAILDEHPTETMTMLGLLCFVEPDDIDNYPIKDYLAAFTEILDSDEVIDFFTALLGTVSKLGLTLSNR